MSGLDAKVESLSLFGHNLRCVVCVFGEEGVLGAGGGGQGGETGAGGGERGDVACQDADEKGYHGAGPLAGHRGKEGVEAVAGLGRGPGVAQDSAGGIEQGLEARIDLAVVQADHPHAAAEDRQPGNQARGKGRVVVVVAQGLKEMGDEGVDLVVGAGRAPRELENAHVGGADVEGYGPNIVVHVENDVAGVASCTWHIGADKAGKVAVDNLDEVALLEVDAVEREVRQAVAVGAGDSPEAVHVAVGYRGVPSPGVAVVD